MTGAALLVAFFSGVSVGALLYPLVVLCVRFWEDTRPYELDELDELDAEPIWDWDEVWHRWGVAEA